MPNHVDTKLTVTGEEKEVQRFVDTCMGTEYDKFKQADVIAFDFNLICPCHEDLLKARSPAYTDKDVELARKNGATEKQIKDIIDQVELTKKNMERFGYPDWYSFCSNEWGTKWGAYDCKIEQEEAGLYRIRYNTAWSPATAFFHKLAKEFPKLTFEVHAIDEGFFYAITQVWKDGEYSEDILGGNDIQKFANEFFNGNFKPCECGEWFNPDYHEDNWDENICSSCNEHAEEN